MKYYMVAGILLVAIAIFYATGYSFLGTPTGNVVYSEPTVLNKTVYPEKVAHGDVLLETLFLEDEYGIESVTGEIEGIDNLTFSLIDGTLKNGTWQNAWIVHTTENMKWYTTTITIRNVKGEVTATSLLWQDPTVYHPASQVTAGTFDAGDFVFPDNLNVTGNINVVNGNINVQGSDIIPGGLIVMWSGAYDEIPSGWALCNGSNGTPNLTDRFIYGVNASYASGNDGDINATGGTSSHSHTIKDFDTFTEDYVCAPNDGGIEFKYWEWQDSNRFCKETSSNPVVDLLEGGDDARRGSSTSGDGDEYDWITSDDSTIPSYYKLAFIMKL